MIDAPANGTKNQNSKMAFAELIEKILSNIRFHSKPVRNFKKRILKSGAKK